MLQKYIQYVCNVADIQYRLVYNKSLQQNLQTFSVFHSRILSTDPVKFGRLRQICLWMKAVNRVT